MMQSSYLPDAVDSTEMFFSGCPADFIRRNRDCDMYVDFPKCRVYIRKDTTDAATFCQLFLKKEYKIPFTLNFKIRNVLDIGANVGYFAVWMAHAYGRDLEKMVSVEPDSENFAMLVENTQPLHALFGYTQQRAGVWPESCRLSVFDPGEGAWSIQVKPDPQGTIEAISVMDIIDQNFVPDAIIDVCKIDIEGSELEVFSAENQEWIDRCRLIICETHDRFRPGSHDAVMNRLIGWKCELRGDNYYFLNPKYGRG